MCLAVVKGQDCSVDTNHPNVLPACHGVSDGGINVAETMYGGPVNIVTI